MSRKIDDAVRTLVLNELPLVTTLFLRKVNVSDDTALQELHETDDLIEMAEQYFRHFDVLSEGFSLKNYFLIQSTGQSKTQKPSPLTIRMFIESARAKRWLYK